MTIICGLWFVVCLYLVRVLPVEYLCTKVSLGKFKKYVATYTSMYMYMSISLIFNGDNNCSLCQR